MKKVLVESCGECPLRPVYDYDPVCGRKMMVKRYLDEGIHPKCPLPTDHTDVLVKALENLKKHLKGTVPEGYQLSTVYSIANKVLEEMR